MTPDTNTNTPPAAVTSPPVQLPYTKDSFVSDQDVRWCPGCGDYSILSTMQRMLAKSDFPREKYVFVSGIGCSSRFPYYMKTYGFHSIHGRAPSVATGLKCVNPDLKIWVITGDGDGLSIGGNHLIHCMRRNVDLNILLVNNRIYGLTKGQYSPTSPVGQVTKSSPYGSIEHPINALCIAIASEATFIARTLDTDPMQMAAVLERAAAHKGISFVEIYQNCIIFNDKAFGPVTGRETREDRMVYLEHGKPLVFGKKRERAIRMKGLQPEIVELSKVDPKDLLIHNEKDPSTHYAYLLTQMEFPEMPVPFGVFRAIEKPTYEDMMEAQIQEIVKAKGKSNLKNLIYGPNTWTVK
jgi:2-oxoglutarate ferredoxin oxidoreductase subunit beta